MIGFNQMRTVQKVKDKQIRDVVTELDMKLHEITEQFMTERLPKCRLFSEEGQLNAVSTDELLSGEWLIVDPLDGTSNYAIGMPNFGYMSAYLRSGYLDSTVIVLPEQSQYIVQEGELTLYAQPLPLNRSSEYGSVYYAYPPQLDNAGREARGLLLSLIDSKSAGMYRYGSACLGLYRLLCGKHMAFIGHDIRLWDAIAFLPVLVSKQIKIRYKIHGSSITLLASEHEEFLDSAAKILKNEQGLTLHDFNIDYPKLEAK
jgi:fructose-1,6-bisphosphatase/inositol monophosphatase family enzyme